MAKVSSFRNKRASINETSVPFENPGGSMSIKRFLTPSNADSVGTLEKNSALGSGLGPSGGMPNPQLEGVKIIGISNKKRNDQ